MIKEVKTEAIKHEYYCDLCIKQQHGYSSYGSITHDSELLEECRMCGKQVCPKCRGDIPTVNSGVSDITLCNNCLEQNKDILEAMQGNIGEFNARDKELRGQLFKNMGGKK